MFVRWLYFFTCFAVSGVVFSDRVSPPSVVQINSQVLIYEDTARRLLRSLDVDTKVIEESKNITIEESKNGLWSEVFQAYLSSNKTGWRLFSCKSKGPKNLHGIDVNSKGIVRGLLLCD